MISCTHGCMILSGYRIPRWRLLFNPMELLSWFTSGVCGPLNMRSSVAPIMPLAQPAYVNEQSHRGDVKKKTFVGFEKVLQR